MVFEVDGGLGDQLPPCHTRQYMHAMVIQNESVNTTNEKPRQIADFQHYTLPIVQAPFSTSLMSSNHISHSANS